MPIGSKCKIEGCNKLVTQRKHATCPMHFSRKRRTGSYDLPNKPKVGDKIVKICSIHGQLTSNQVRETYRRRRYGKNALPYPYMDAYCKSCYEERLRVNRLKRNYGLTPEQYKEMFDKQNGKCDMCKEPERIITKYGKVRKLAVDHCHKTNTNRGLLCAHCNTAIGMLRESIRIIRNAEDYLRRWGATE